MNIATQLLGVLAIITLGGSVFTVVYVMAGAPSRLASRLGIRGLKRQHALEEYPLWKGIERLVRWLGVRLSGLITPATHLRIDRMLSLAGGWLGITPDEFVALSLTSAGCGVAVGSVVGVAVDVPALAILCAILGAALPYLAILSETQRRQRQVSRGLPYVLDLLALAMSAGKDFPGAIREVINKSSDPDDAMVEELGVMLRELQLGQTRRTALRSLVERVPLDCMREFANAIIQAEERGNPVAAVLQIQAGTSRQRRSLRAEEGAAKAGVAMVAPLFLLFFAVMLILMGPIVLKLMSAAT